MKLLIWSTGIVAALAGAPLLPGIVNRVKAFFAGRKGPSVFQLYFDLAKLSRKAPVYSTTTSWVFRIAPVVNCAAVIGALLLLPIAGKASLFGFAGDVVLMLYVCGLGRLFTVLGALDTGSSFEGMGSSRECQFAILSEGAILAVFGALILLTHRVSLSGILAQMSLHLWSVDGTALILVGIGFFIVILAECCRVPVDDPDTHLELTMIHEAMILDNSGADLALIHYAAALKMWVLLLIEILLICPKFGGGAWGQLAGEILCVMLGAAVIGAVESVMARYRFRKVPQLLSSAIGMGLLAVVLLILFQA